MILSFFIILSTSIFGQSWDNHPELNWKSFETENFIFYFHEGTKRSALEASKVAEVIYEPVTSLYDFKPEDKTAVILKDTDDFSNGLAMFFDNKIEIWTKPMDLDLRGNHRWIQNVLTHEFVHIVQLGASMKYSNKIPAIYLQVIDYEDEKRDDVLYGYPNRIISTPIPGTSVPPWFAEGVAQYMLDNIHYDFWDSHRDMILRDAVMNDKLLSYNQMSTFGNSGIGNENVYNQGFAFVNHIASTFGETVLKDITYELSKFNVYSFDQAFENTTGMLIDEFFTDFENKLKAKYSHYKQKSHRGIKVIESDGIVNINPVWSADGTKIMFLSNKDNDFFSKTDLFIHNLAKGSSKKIVSGVKGTPSWVNDSTIVYSKINMPNENGSRFYDIYQFEINSEKEKKLTNDSRLYSPSFNKKLNKILAIDQKDGTSNIMVSAFTDSLIFDYVTSFDDGFQIFNADWMDSSIIFDAVTMHGRDIYKIDSDKNILNSFKSTVYDERDPFFSGNLNYIFWSEDKNGVHNLFCSMVGSEDIIQLTDVSGGIFYPSVSDDGKLAFSIFDEGIYKLAIVDNFLDLVQNGTSISYNDEWSKKLDFFNSTTKQIIQDDTFTNEKIKKYESGKMNSLILPRVFFDYGSLKPGFYLMSTDILNKLSFFAGGGVNRKKDLDLFMMFENYNYSITPYVNLFWVTRNKETSQLYSDQLEQEYENIPIKNNYLFNLFSMDAGTRFSFISNSKYIPGRHKFWLNYQYNNYREKVEQLITQFDQQGNIEFYDSFDFSFDYYRSHILSVEYIYKKQKNHFLKNMLPNNGFEIKLKLSYEFNDFLNGFGIYEDSGTFGSILSPNNTAKYEIDFIKNWNLSQTNKLNTSLISKTSIGHLSNENIDDFFYFFGGGMPGIKGYSYYDESLKGVNKIIQSFILRYPFFSEKSKRIAFTNLKHSTIGFILQAGDVFANEKVGLDDLKLSAGIELRLYGYSVYSYPLAIEYEYHIAKSYDEGKHYFKILFDFVE